MQTAPLLALLEVLFPDIRMRLRVTEMMLPRLMLNMRGLGMGSEEETITDSRRMDQDQGRNKDRDSGGSAPTGVAAALRPGSGGIGGLIRSLSTRGRDILERPEIWREISDAESGWFVVCRGEECEVVRVPTGEEAGTSRRRRRRSSEGQMAMMSSGRM
jgi:hypothetical protein